MAMANGYPITKQYKGSTPEYWIHRGGMAHGPFNTFEAAVNATSLLRRIYG